MHLDIIHTLSYTYSTHVSLTPHTLYVMPKALPNQEVHNFELDINPVPNFLVKNVDAEGNIQHIAYINEPCISFDVRVHFQMNTLDFNPFDFVYFPFEAKELPFSYPEKEKVLLSAYLNQEQVTTTIHHFARQLAAEKNWITADFLMHLSTYIRANFMYEKREFGAANSAEKTLLSAKGTCRDFAVLMIATCKALGIAARFVSGYCFGSELQAHELHAWVEVFLPGGGWRGFDPTEGKAVDKNYVMLAASAQPELINPVTGSFRSNIAANSTLQANVQLEQVYS